MGRTEADLRALATYASASETHDICPMCHGTGERHSHKHGRVIIQCPDCKGRGVIDKEV